MGIRQEEKQAGAISMQAPRAGARSRQGEQAGGAGRMTMGCLQDRGVRFKEFHHSYGRTIWCSACNRGSHGRTHTLTCKCRQARFRVQQAGGAGGRTGLAGPTTRSREQMGETPGLSIRRVPEDPARGMSGSSGGTPGLDEIHQAQRTPGCIACAFGVVGGQMHSLPCKQSRAKGCAEQGGLLAGLPGGMPRNPQNQTACDDGAGSRSGREEQSGGRSRSRQRVRPGTPTRGEQAGGAGKGSGREERAGRACQKDTQEDPNGRGSPGTSARGEQAGGAGKMHRGEVQKERAAHAGGAQDGAAAGKLQQPPAAAGATCCRQSLTVTAFAALPSTMVAAFAAAAPSMSTQNGGPKQHCIMKEWDALA